MLPMDIYIAIICSTSFVDNVLLTGGCAGIAGIRDRVEADLQCCRPFQSKICVKIASDPAFGSWKGARKWCMDADRSEYAMTKAKYEEFGGDYLFEHQISNRFYRTPTQKIPVIQKIIK